MDTSTGSFTGCPTADLDKKQEGSKQFPNFALFTTRLRRVRLSQSGGGKTSSIIWLKVLPQKGFIGFAHQDSVSIFGASNFLNRRDIPSPP
jgi:hypothetical protein